MTDEALFQLVDALGENTGVSAAQAKSNAAAAKKNARQDATASKKKNAKRKGNEASPPAEVIEVMVSPEQTFSQHVRETLQYLMRVDASGKQRSKIDAFYHMSLYAICNESITVQSGGREKAIQGWSQ